MRASRYPESSPAAAPVVTGPGPSPRTPGSINRAPKADAPPEISLPRWRAALAAGIACSTLQAAPRSGSRTSAYQGGAPAPGGGSTPSATSAAESACLPTDDNTATVRPAWRSSATARARASSRDPLAPSSRGRMSSNTGRNSPRASTSTETRSAPVRCASATTAEASRSCMGRKSASTAESEPLAETPGTRCQPGRRPLSVKTSCARFHAVDSSSAPQPRMRATRRSSVHSTRGSMTIASTRSNRRKLSGRNGNTAC